MATARREPITPQYKIILELNEVEARTLLKTLGYVGGFPGGSRGHIDRIAFALSQAGVVGERLDVTGGGIWLNG